MMLAYILAAFLAVLSMARKGRARRKFRRYIRGRVKHEFQPGTLAPLSLFGEKETQSLDESAWLSSVKLLWSCSGFTSSDNRGPLMVGVAHSDYSNAEIESWVEASGQWTSGNKIQEEIRKRHIRQVGIFQIPLGSSGAIPLNDGKPITTKCGWQLVTDQTLKFWVYNMGTASLADGVDILISGHANLWPN